MSRECEKSLIGEKGYTGGSVLINVQYFPTPDDPNSQNRIVCSYISINASIVFVSRLSSVNGVNSVSVCSQSPSCAITGLFVTVISVQGV